MAPRPRRGLRPEPPENCIQGGFRSTRGYGTLTSVACRDCGASLSSIDEIWHHMEGAHPAVSPNSAGDHLCPGCPTTPGRVFPLEPSEPRAKLYIPGRSAAYAE